MHFLKEHTAQNAISTKKKSKNRKNKKTSARWEHYKETGESVSNEAMIEWLDSWGTEQEKPCPVKQFGYLEQPKTWLD